MSTKTFYMKNTLLITIAFLATVFSGTAQKMESSLPRSTPEKEGVSAAGLLAFLDAVGKSKTEFHSMMVLRHGKVIAEGWWSPYAPSLKHMLYSTSKSFTAAAIGFALTEKRLSLDDKVISFFPNDKPDTVNPWLAELTVRDALMMSDGMDPDPSGPVSMSANWEKAFLGTPIVHEPGSVFLYNSVGTYMLSAIVTKVTGQKVLDYLQPRLFDPLGIHGIDWETSPQGANTGGWGLRLKTEDMAKFGQLYLQKGNWKGHEILPAAWVEDATTKHILQDPSASQGKRDSSDWLQGYCYQMWRCRHNGVRADGAFGQYIIMLPELDAVVALTAESPDMQEEINLVWDYLLPAIHTGVLPADAKSDQRLKDRLSALALPIPAAMAGGGTPVDINGQTYTFEANDTKIKQLSFSLANGVCRLGMKGDTADYEIPFGEGHWEAGVTTRPGPALTERAQHAFVGLPGFKTEGAYDWKDANTLELTLRYIESPHKVVLVCHFDGTGVKVDYKSGGANVVELRGTKN